MVRMSGLDWTALVLVIVGGLNWLLIGLFDFNLVAFIFGSIPLLERIVYVLVGLSALYLIYWATRLGREEPRWTGGRPVA